MSIKMNEHFDYANVRLLSCQMCQQEAIVSVERTDQNTGYRCPYCGTRRVDVIAETTDETRPNYEFGTFTLTIKREEK